MADLLVDSRLAREALDAIPETPLSTSSTLIAHQVRAIYHAVFGDPASAAQYSERLQALATTHELSALSVSALLTAELARRMTAPTPMSLDVLTILYDRCTAASMYDAALKVSARIGSILMEQGSIDSAARWSACGDALVRQGELKRQVVDYVTLKLDFALLNGDQQLARELLEEIPVRCPIYTSPKWRMEYLAYRVRAYAHESRLRDADKLLEEMLAWHTRVRHLGRHDDFMLALWMLLRRHERDQEASRLLAEYLASYRRERVPCSYVLRTHTARDSAWDLAPFGQFGTPTAVSTAQITSAAIS
jgi:hypothetical protein